MSSSAIYISAADTTVNVNALATAGWVPLPRDGGGSVGFQVVMPATGAPIGLLVFEITNDENPSVASGLILGATVLTLSAAQIAAQPSTGAAVNFLFEFNPAPTAKWIKMRYARTSGGNNPGMSVGVAVRMVH